MKQLWGIRHVRWAWLSWRFWRWWDEVGCCLGVCPNEADLDFLERVWRGEA